uniref:Uncharacterized protein n=1 Tax=Bursaphelenchus xylophilus TaxID=6326 RepID=A0A1I7SFF1_BURXY
MSTKKMAEEEEDGFDDVGAVELDPPSDAYARPKTPRCTRVQALSQVAELMSKTRPGMDVSSTLHRALMRWQSMLGIRSNENVLTQQTADMFSIKRKTAWN